MNSNQKKQQEESIQNLHATEAIEKVKDLVEKAKTCFFCTGQAASPSNGVTPMSAQQVDAQGNIWFLSADDSNRNQEIAVDPSVKLFFQGSPHAHFLYVRGKATISKDKNKIKEIWEPLAKTWFTEGENDPRITAIKVSPIEGYYWDNKHGTAVAMVKMLFGAVVGKTMDDSVEGKVRL